MGDMESLSALDLSGNSLTGEIPQSFNKLRNLNLLNLFRNDFNDRILAFIGDLPWLESLQLWSNNFTSELPESLGSNERLMWLEVAGGCKTLKRVRLGNNHLNGTILAGLFRMPVVKLLELRDNFFSGELPVEMSGEILSLIDLSNNQITGGIPSAIGNLSGLGSAFLQNNRFTSQIPSELFSLTRLSHVNLSFNNLAGEIPSSIGNCTSLISVDFSSNQISGEIPSTIANLTVLSDLNLSTNSLSGKIPKERASIPSLTMLDLSKNNLFGRIPRDGQFSMFNVTSFQDNTNLCWPTWKSGLLATAQIWHLEYLFFFS